jgi:hypothetical protein
MLEVQVKLGTDNVLGFAVDVIGRESIAKLHPA